MGGLAYDHCEVTDQLDITSLIRLLNLNSVLTPYKRVIPNPKMVFIFPILCILVIIFPKCMK